MKLQWELLDQDKIWIDGLGLTNQLEDMSNEHLVNLKGWLIRHAPNFMLALMSDMYHAASHMNGEMAIDAIDGEIRQLEQQNAYLWMEERLLYRKINRLIDERRGYHYVRVLPQEASTN
jgi:hypothetical protein